MTSQVEELKTKANAAFSAGKNDEAIQLYTQAIGLDDKNHVLYSNRSAAYAKANKYEDALKDAEKCISLKPDFMKGYSRKGAALSFLKRYDEAIKVYEEGLKIDPNNQQLLSDLETVRKDAEGGAGGFNFFSDPQFLNQIMNNPKARELLKDPEIQMLMKLMQQQPNNASLLNHPKMMKLISLALGLDTGDDNDSKMETDSPASSTKKETNTSSTSSKSTNNTSSSSTTKSNEQNKNLTSQQAQAEAEKEKGNEAYKKKDFETAINHYNKAIEIDPVNMTYYTNRAAVYFEQKRWEDCIKECEKAIEIGRENKADYKLIAKAYARIANVKTQEKDYKGAIKYYDHSLSEHRNPEVIKKKQEIEKLLKEEEQLAYINPEIAEQEKAKGNEYFQKADYPNALKHYTEAIKRNPTDAKIYSNRAACYTKLMEFRLALKDSDEGIKLDPNFVKCYLRKGHALMAMKDYGQAMAAFGKALEIDPNCQEAMDSYRQCASKASDDPEEIRKRAANDPEIQQILTDPGMRLILEQMQNEPQALREHLRNPAIAQKIQKLIDAGIIGIRQGP
jgi:stress-induced-phosphoprotein 1